MKTPRIFYKLNITVTRKVADNSIMVLPSGETNKWTCFTSQYHSWREPSTADNLYKFIFSLKYDEAYDKLRELSGKLTYTLRSENIYG